MKKRAKSNRRAVAFAAVALFGFLFAAQTQVAAQGKVQRLKVGDRVEDMNMAGEKGTVVEVLETEPEKSRNCYLVAYDYQKRGGDGGRPGRVCVWGYDDKLYLLDASGKRVRDANAPVAGETETKLPTVETKNNGGATPNATKTPTGTPNNQPPDEPGAPKSISAKYGSREPQTCENTKAPAKGAITAALAKQYFICGAEGVFGEYLYLMENVKVQVGAARPFNLVNDIMTDADTRFPIYTIRGSHTRYQCEEQISNSRFYPDNVGKNCTAYENPKAEGICYKTTFGEWKCSMNDSRSTDSQNKRYKVAPPQAAKTAAETIKPSR